MFDFISVWALNQLILAALNNHFFKAADLTFLGICMYLRRIWQCFHTSVGSIVVNSVVGIWHEHEAIIASQVII
jgi:hypothetical protein